MKSLKIKRKIIEDIYNLSITCNCLMLIEYKKISVLQMNKIKQIARKFDFHTISINNKLAYKSYQGTQFNKISPFLKYQNIIVHSNFENLNMFSSWREIIQENENFSLKCLFYNRKFFDKKEFCKVSNLPNRSQAVCDLLNSLNKIFISLLRSLSIHNLLLEFLVFHKNKIK